MLAASARQKWQWAAIITFWYTLPLPLFGLVDPMLNIAEPGHWLGFPVLCSGIWVVVFPIVLLSKRRGMERQLKDYQKTDKMIKSGLYQQLAALPLTGWTFRVTNLLSNAERKRFFEIGYPQEGEPDASDLIELSWFAKRADNTQSVSNWFAGRHPDDTILFASIATMLEVSKKSPISRLPRLYQRQGIVLFTGRFLFFKATLFSLAALRYAVKALMRVAFSAWSFYVACHLYSQEFTLSLSLIVPTIALISAILVLASACAYGLLVFQYRPHQEQILFGDIKKVDVDTVPGVMQRRPSLTLTIPNKAINIVFEKTLPHEIIQLVRCDWLRPS